MAWRRDVWGCPRSPLGSCKLGLEAECVPAVRRMKLINEILWPLLRFEYVASHGHARTSGLSVLLGHLGQWLSLVLITTFRSFLAFYYFHLLVHTLAFVGPITTFAQVHHTVFFKMALTVGYHTIHKVIQTLPQTQEREFLKENCCAVRSLHRTSGGSRVQLISFHYI